LIEQSTHSFPEWHLRPLNLIGHPDAFFLDGQYIANYGVIFTDNINDDCV
jgi:hypothetical protein|tara:strand:- start:654 stop:803 length:150 start_codon:yes stop_codon:yes gene_type:complete